MVFAEISASNHRPKYLLNLSGAQVSIATLLYEMLTLALHTSTMNYYK